MGKVTFHNGLLLRVPPVSEWTDELVREIDSAGAKATRETLDNWISPKTKSPRDKILDFRRSQQSSTIKLFESPAKQEKTVAKTETTRPSLKSLPNPEKSKLEDIIEKLSEDDILITDAPPDKTEYLTELAKTVWYAQKYLNTRSCLMVPFRLDGTKVFPTDIKMALEDQFIDLMTKSLLSEDTFIYQVTAKVFKKLPAGGLLQSEEPLESAFEKTIGQLTDPDANEGDRETAISIINRLAPALYQGHPMINRMAYKVHPAIEHARDHGNAEMEAKLIDTYGAVAEKFYSNDSDLRRAWNLLSQERIDRPEIVMTAAESVCNTLTGIFPNLNYLNMPTPIVMR